MDLYCTTCGEPWELDALHDAPVPYEEAKRRFPSEGCAVFGTGHNKAMLNNESDRERAAVASVLHDVLGDDLDGIAAELEDMLL